jgi:fructokinase
VIAVIGEALIDLVVGPGGQVTATPGGAPFNTARTCGRLGADVAYVGAVSTDRFGLLLADRLAADGVSLDRVVRVDKPTTLAAAELDESGAATYRFYIDGTSVLELPGTVDLTGARAVFAGGLGLGLEPIATTIERLVTGAPAGCLTMVDINCRPATITDRASYLARLDRVLARIDIIKVSDDDLEYLAPGSSPVDAAAGLLDRGAQVVLLTAGAGDVEVLTAAGRFDVAVEPVSVVDTIGAGDAFDGGFLAWWIGSGRGRADLSAAADLRSAVEAATAVAGVTCTRRGADPPHRADLPAGWAG